MLDNVLKRIAPHARLLEPVFAASAKGLFRGPTPLRALASSCGHSTARLPFLEEALRVSASAGVVRQNAMGAWLVTLEPEACDRLASMLHGVNLYLDQVHHDADTVAVVISHPAQPSRLVRELEQTLQGTWGLAETAEVLLELARRASHRFTVMTPFVDEDGAGRIIELLELTAPAVRREVIVRGGLPPALQQRSADLRRLEAAVYDFRISRDEGAGTETFHAKVVRVDSDECYVGSSNMTAWSFNYSLELGFHVRGAAGKRISQVVDAVLQVSHPVPA